MKTLQDLVSADASLAARANSIQNSGPRSLACTSMLLMLEAWYSAVAHRGVGIQPIAAPNMLMLAMEHSCSTQTNKLSEHRF